MRQVCGTQERSCYSMRIEPPKHPRPNLWVNLRNPNQDTRKGNTSPTGDLAIACGLSHLTTHAHHPNLWVSLRNPNQDDGFQKGNKHICNILYFPYLEDADKGNALCKLEESVDYLDTMQENWLNEILQTLRLAWISSWKAARSNTCPASAPANLIYQIQSPKAFAFYQNTAWSRQN